MAVTVCMSDANTLLVPSAMQSNSFASLGMFVSQDIVECFMRTAYQPTEQGVAELCLLKGVSKTFYSLATHQMTHDTAWLGALAKDHEVFRTGVPDMLKEGSYDAFFVGMRTFRFMLLVQRDGWRHFLSHSAGRKGCKYSSVVMAAMQYHQRDVVVQRYGSAVLMNLLQDEVMVKGEEMPLAAVMMAAIVASPADMNLQQHAVMCLCRIVQNIGSYSTVDSAAALKAVSAVNGHDVMAYVVYRMTAHTKDKEFQEAAMLLVTCLSSSWQYNAEKIAKLPPASLLALVYARGMASAIVDIMRLFKDCTKIQENGCMALAHMASNNLGTMPDVPKCIMYVNNSMQMTVGSTLHSTAMVATTALCVERFSCNSATLQPHKVNQDAFANAGILNLMLSSLNEYAKTTATWAMKVVVNVIHALDSLCRHNTQNTMRFIQSNGVNIMVKAVFRNNNSFNFRDECWMAMFTMIENILMHPEITTATTAADTANAHGRFSSILSRKYATAHRNGSGTVYSLTEIVLLAVRGNNSYVTSGPFMQTSLRILCLCMQNACGLRQIARAGTYDVVKLMQSDKARRGNRLGLQEDCLNMLALVLTKAPSPNLHNGLIELAVADRWSIMQSAQYDNNMLTLRTVVVRLQMEQCAGVLLASQDLTISVRVALLAVVTPPSTGLVATNYFKVLPPPYVLCVSVHAVFCTQKHTSDARCHLSTRFAISCSDC